MSVPGMEWQEEARVKAVQNKAVLLQINRAVDTTAGCLQLMCIRAPLQAISGHLTRTSSSLCRTRLLVRQNSRQQQRPRMAAASSGAAAASGDDGSSSNSRSGSSSHRAPPLPPAWPELRRVLFNAPNSVGWVRLGLLLAAVHARPQVAAWLFLANMLLDAVDGWLARTLRQATAFGAVFDVLLDVATRGWLWVNALPPGLALSLPLLEMTVFAFMHKVAGADWKAAFYDDAPSWVRAVMAGGLRNPAGAVAVTGLMGCPLWAWACRHLPPGHVLAAPAWGALLVPARMLAGAVELWVVWRYLAHLLRQDAAAG